MYVKHDQILKMKLIALIFCNIFMLKCLNWLICLSRPVQKLTMQNLHVLIFEHVFNLNFMQSWKYCLKIFPRHLQGFLHSKEL